MTTHVNRSRILGIVNATPEPPAVSVSRCASIRRTTRHTSYKDASFKTSNVRGCTVRSIHEDWDITLSIFADNVLLQPLRESIPHTYDPHQLPLARLFLSIDGFAHTGDRERVTLDGPDRRKREEEMLTGLPSEKIFPGLADVQGDIERTAGGDAYGVLREKLDVCWILVRGMKIAEDNVADVAASPVLGPYRSAGPHVAVPTV